MTAELTPMQTFEEKVKSRLKETIADMLPDEALAALVQKAVEEQFFKTRTDGDLYRPKVIPSWFVAEVARLSEPLVREHVSKAFEERRGEIEQAIQEFMKEQNLALLMTTAIAEKTSQAMWENAQKVIETVRRGY